MSFEQPMTAEPIPGLKDQYPTKDGRLIHVTPIGREHLRAHPSVIALLDEAMTQVELPMDGSASMSQIELHRPLEKASLVETANIGLDDEAWFSQRLNRRGASHVVLEGTDEMISTIVIIAKPPVAAPDRYILRTAYIGTLSENEPWTPTSDEVAQAKAQAFWSTHALVYDETHMGKPFRSTWRQVLNEAAQAQTSPTAETGN